MRKSLKQLAILGSLAVAAFLLIIYFGRMDDPRSLPLLGLFVLGYPLVLLFNILFLIFWTVLKKKWAFMHLIALLLTWSLQSDFIQLTLPSAEDGPVRLMTFNTQLLGFYQFEKNEELRAQNLDMLSSIDADILCFQEFYKIDNPKGFQTISLIQDMMGPFDIHEKYTHEFVHKQYFGVVTFSKYPILHRGFIPFQADINNFCIYSDILLPSSDTIRVFNAHLASIHFRPEDYAFSRGEFENWSEFTSGFNDIRVKMEESNARRSNQILTILAEVEKSPFPVIFAGDLNAPPFSYAYYRARGSLQDAFRTAGSGIAETYKSKIPVLRIDHLFHDDRIAIKRYDRVRAGASDHYPVVIEFDVSDE